METVLIVIHLLVVLGMIVLVLLQRSEGGALGMGGGGGGLMTSRGTANVLTRGTAILAAIFFVTSLSLTLLHRWDNRPADLLDNIPAASETTGEGEDAKGLLDALKKQSTPEGPQVPAAQ
ncbi:preprotein translocase subunit SecG [Polycladidibacter stylochi]|uniref:preprotein translocase subunit SecG n=1 Tax=Polycladidibacter stylochi TaxID=1807766 RepID=UPI0008333A87|nr:preprotein translocase subunit SecG [Pseudovibrio stylochi]